MALPNLFIPGAPKSGTTYVGAILGQHPDIFVFENKECKFFSSFKADDEITPMEMARYELTYFKKYAGQRYVGDFDPGYMYMQKHPRVIVENVGGTPKAIVLLRSPARRAFSEYHHSHRAMRIDKPFESYLRPGHIVFDRSLYTEPTRRLVDAFGKENCLLLVFEEYVSDHVGFLAHKLWEFLDLPPVPVNAQVLRNQTSSRQLRIESLANRADPQTYQKLSMGLPRTYVSFWGNDVHEVHRGLTEHAARYVDHVLSVVTTKLSAEEEKEINRRLFIDDIRKTEELTGFDLSGWL
jgi:hypothetical protein